MLISYSFYRLWLNSKTILNYFFQKNNYNNKIEMLTNSFDDIEKIGPGIWFKIHMDAIKATTLSLKESFVVNINALCDGFRCKTCQPHFRKFINENPLKKYFDIKDGIFQWTWELHNDVNSRLNK